MRSKTVSLSAEAYKRINQHRRNGESISATVERLIKPPLDVEELISNLRKLDPAILKDVDKEITSRRKLRPTKRRVG